MPSLAEIAATFGSRGAGGDIWKPTKDSQRFRIYRVYKDGVPTVVAHTETRVWTGHAYTEPSEETENARRLLLASGTKEDKEKARSLRPSTVAWLVGVLPDNPQGYVFFKAPQTVIQRVLVLLATAGNDGLPVRFPSGADPKFFELAEKGANLVCGPSGQDLGISFDEKAPPMAMYDIALLPKTPATKTLPFSEEESPDPKVVADRMKAARDKKGG